MLSQAPEEARKIIQRSPELLKIKVNEFRRGERPDGTVIGYYRNPGYGLFKRRLNPLAGGTVDLTLTGSFTRGLFVESLGNSRYMFDSNDDKAPDLFNKYGNENRGLNDFDWLKIQKEVLLPRYIQFIKKGLGQ